MNDIMLDLETLGKGPRSMIISIGAVRMDLENFKLCEEYYQIVKPDVYGEMDPDTVLWWLQQSEESRSMFRAPAERIKTLPETLQDFTLWMYMPQKSSIEAQPIIWGNGAAFDNVILRSAYQSCQLHYPVSHQNDRCYRTVKSLLLGKEKKFESGVAHHSLHDARNQAQTLIKMLRDLKELQDES